VLATGSHWQGPLNFPDDKADFRKYVDTWREKFKAAKDITVVGGGAVGIGKQLSHTDVIPTALTCPFVQNLLES
jgi:apoptosis-inducing factor 2